MAVFGLVFIALAVWGHQEIVAKTEVVGETKVSITTPGTMEALRESGVSVRVIDASDMRDPSEAIEAYTAGLYDMLILSIKPITSIDSACNDASECAEAIEAACDALGADVVAVEFSAMGKDNCNGTCSNGSDVDVTCSTID
jgi:SepF-like predicted cell division protein (DUF552 family)